MPTSAFASYGDDHGLSGIEGAVAVRAVGKAATFVFFLVRQPELALVQARRDDQRAGGVALAIGRLDLEGALAGNRRDFAEADLDTRDHRIVGQARRHLRAVEDLVEILEFAEVHDLTARRELVEAKYLEAGSGDVGGGGQSGRTGADDDDVV